MMKLDEDINSKVKVFMIDSESDLW